MKQFLKNYLTAVFICLAAGNGSAQSPPVQQNTAVSTQDEVLRVETNLVGVPVTVMDRNGQRITDLKQAEFHVFDDGVEQQVAFFAPAQTPVTVLLLFDKYVLGKRDLLIKDYRELANMFIQKLRPGDRVIVAKTGSGVSDIFVIGADGQLQKEQLKPKWRLSEAIHDAVSVAIKRMNALPGRKAIVFFSDGMLRYIQQITIVAGSGSLISEHKTDMPERSNIRSTVREAEESDAPIYTIRYDTMTEVFRSGSYLKGKPDWQRQMRLRILGEYREGAEYLGILAAKSGARRFYAKDARGVDQFFSDIAAEISQQYNLGYYPKTQSTGSNNERHEITVRVDRKDVVVRSRSSYVTTSPKK